MTWSLNWPMLGTDPWSVGLRCLPGRAPFLEVWKLQIVTGTQSEEIEMRRVPERGKTPERALCLTPAVPIASLLMSFTNPLAYWSCHLHIFSWNCPSCPPKGSLVISLSCSLRALYPDPKSPSPSAPCMGSITHSLSRTTLPACPEAPEWGGQRAWKTPFSQQLPPWQHSEAAARATSGQPEGRVSSSLLSGARLHQLAQSNYS